LQFIPNPQQQVFHGNLFENAIVLLDFVSSNLPVMYDNFVTNRSGPDPGSARATELACVCRRLNIKGMTLHSYRYSWTERDKSAADPGCHAQEALGHNSKAVHCAYSLFQTCPCRDPGAGGVELASKHESNNLLAARL
jgi:hypothetical protein